MASHKRQKNPKSASGQIQVDSKAVLQSKGELQSFTETDALDERNRHLFDPAAEYKMSHPRRGLALIFNHERFFWHLRLPERRGTHADRENLKHWLAELGFEVKCFDDLKAGEVLEEMHSASTKNSFDDADCFMCIFLSHGEDDHVYAYDAKIKIQDMTAMFKGDKCPSLIGKPKIFVFQACRGDKHDEAVFARDGVDGETEESDNETEMDAAALYTLPAGADFLMCYSVAEGYYSHRETVNGSWYIQDLCEMIRRHGSSLEFTELLTLVNRKVSHRRVDVCKDVSAIGKKQIPCFASMLTKKLRFYPKTK